MRPIRRQRDHNPSPLDPRTKLFLFLLAIPPFFLPLPMGALLYYGGGVMGLCLRQAGWCSLGKVMGSVKWLLLVMAVGTPFFSSKGRVLLALGEGFALTEGGMERTLRLLVRFVGLLLLFHLLVGATRKTELIGALRWAGLPHAVALGVTISLAFLPEWRRHYHNVREAHQLRDEGERNGGRMRRYLPHLASILLLAVRRISSTAMSLEARGFGRHSPRSQWSSLPPLRESLKRDFPSLLGGLLFLLLPLLWHLFFSNGGREGK